MVTQMLTIFSDDSSAESEVDRLAGEISRDSDTDDDEEFGGFEFEMPENVAFQVGHHPIKKLNTCYKDNQLDAAPQVNMDNNAKPVGLI